jgi:two-component system response regulator NreC
MGVINIVVADDHPVVRLGLRTLLESEPNFKVVGEASDGLEAVQKVKRLLPDVVVLDSTMPYLNGIEAARQVRAQFPHIRIVILTMVENEPYTAEVLSSIADANVPKQSPTEDLVIAIHETLARKRHLSAPI